MTPVKFRATKREVAHLRQEVADLRRWVNELRAAAGMKTSRKWKPKAPEGQKITGPVHVFKVKPYSPSTSVVLNRALNRWMENNAPEGWATNIIELPRGLFDRWRNPRYVVTEIHIFGDAAALLFAQQWPHFIIEKKAGDQ